MFKFYEVIFGRAEALCSQMELVVG